MSCLGTPFWCTPRKPGEVHEEGGWQASANVKCTSTVLSEVDSCLNCHLRKNQTMFSLYILSINILVNDLIH